MHKGGQMSSGRLAHNLRSDSKWLKPRGEHVAYANSGVPVVVGFDDFHDTPVYQQLLDERKAEKALEALREKLVGR